MNTATLGIEGMHCEGCARTLEALIRAEPGVRAADVSFQGGHARILYDPQTIGEDQLVKVIERGGYRVRATKA